MKQESKTFEIEFHLKPGVHAMDRPAGEKPKEGTARRRFDRYPRIVQVVDPLPGNAVLPVAERAF